MSGRCRSSRGLGPSYAGGDAAPEQTNARVEFKGVLGVSQDYSDEDRWGLMKAGVSVAIGIDGKVYFALGQTTAVTPMAVTQRVNAFMWERRYMREEGVDQALRRRGADPRLYWVPTVHDDHIGLESSQGFVSYGRLG